MPLSITCDCGARFDVDDLLAGQEVPCPECTEAVKVSGQQVAPRTSLWALAALVVALVGGLTPFGGLLAILVGLLAVLIIFARRKHLTGQWVAFTAIGLGVFSTAVTAALFIKPDLLPIGDWVRERALAGQFDPSGDLKVAGRNNDVTIDRQSVADLQEKDPRGKRDRRNWARDWGVIKRGYSFDPSISDLQVIEDALGQAGQKPRADLLLFNRRRNAYVDVIRDVDTTDVSLQAYRDVLEGQLNPYVPRFLGGEGGGMFNQRDRGGPGGGRPDRGDNPPNFDDHAKDLERLDGHLGREWRATVKHGGQTWRFIIRAYKKPKGLGNPNVGPIYVIRAYTPLSRFKANEAQLTALLDSAHIQP
jgi:hypothetical protein